jgi:hypothetical protein
MWNLISVHLEIVLVSMKYRCTVCAKHTIASENCLEHTRWYSKVMRLKWMLVLLRLKIVLFLMQDRCTVCAERIKGSIIALDTPDRTPR